MEGRTVARPARALDVLADVIADMAAASTVDALRRLVAPAARRLTGADGAALILRRAGHCSCAGEDAAPPLWGGARRPLEDCVAGLAMLRGEPVVVEDAAGDPRVPDDMYPAAHVGSLAVVPFGGPSPLGALELRWAARHRASQAELAAARALASSAGVALERARLRTEVQRRRTSEDDLRRLSQRDPLTGALNRRAWDQILASALRKGERPLHVAMLDLDDFKGYNDRYGHPAGDELLRRAARAWRASIRAGDVLARYGGEEFAVLLAGCEPETADEIAERLRLAMLDACQVSIGIAQWDGAEDAARLVERADGALYEAKRAGRNRVTRAA